MDTIKYYTDAGKYMGWAYTFNVTRLELISWIRSGNYLTYGKTEIRDISKLPVSK